MFAVLSAITEKQANSLSLTTCEIHASRGFSRNIAVSTVFVNRQLVLT